MLEEGHEGGKKTYQVFVGHCSLRHKRVEDLARTFKR